MDIKKIISVRVDIRKRKSTKMLSDIGMGIS